MKSLRWPGWISSAIKRSRGRQQRSRCCASRIARSWNGSRRRAR